MSILKDLLALKNSKETIVESEDLDPDLAGSVSGELQDLHDQLVKIMREVRETVRSLPRSMRGQAEAYWIPHIMIALGGEHEWMTAGHEATMEKLIDELRQRSRETNDDDADGDNFGERSHGHGGDHEDDDDGDHSFGETGHR